MREIIYLLVSRGIGVGSYLDFVCAEEYIRFEVVQTLVDDVFGGARRRWSTALRSEWQQREVANLLSALGLRMIGLDTENGEELGDCGTPKIFADEVELIPQQNTHGFALTGIVGAGNFFHGFKYFLRGFSVHEILRQSVD